MSASTPRQQTIDAVVLQTNVPFLRVRPGCQMGTNLAAVGESTREECAKACVEHGAACVGFEFGNDYGGAQRDFALPNQCHLQSKATRAAEEYTHCDGVLWNLDLYLRYDYEAEATWSEVDLGADGKWRKLSPGCINSNNLTPSLSDRSASACAAACNERADCHGFEFALKTGGVGSCVLQSTAEGYEECIGTLWKVDLYLLPPPAPPPSSPCGILTSMYATSASADSDYGGLYAADKATGPPTHSTRCGNQMGGAWAPKEMDKSEHVRPRNSAAQFCSAQILGIFSKSHPLFCADPHRQVRPLRARHADRDHRARQPGVGDGLRAEDRGARQGEGGRDYLGRHRRHGVRRHPRRRRRTDVQGEALPAVHADRHRRLGVR